MSIRRRIADKQHRWLSQVDLSGVVLSEPVLAEAAPAGFRNLEKRELAQFYKAREVWNLPVGMVEGDTEAQWIGFVLEQLLNLATGRWQIGAAIASRFVVALSQQRETLRPTRVLLDGAEPILVFLRVPRTQKLDSPWDTGGSWKASPTTKLERLLRETGVETGLVTNGEAWRLVVASPSETAAWLTWTTQTWADSPSTLSAFVDLLGETRFFAGPRTGTILELVRRSRERQADVAEQLGTQVREALELFVRELDRVDALVDGDLLRSYTEDEVFEGVAALLMRLVFLLKAEEGGLLPHGSIEYDRAYGILHLLARLERAHRLDPHKLRHSTEAYAQLLGTFRLVHDGSPDPDISVVAYGGELFDPDKYPLLEGRARDGQWLDDRRLKPLPIRDSVLREMLRRLKYARSDNGAVQWVSYRTLEIEQLGHMYEGLLDLRLRRAPVASSLLLLTPTDKVPSPVIATNELLGCPPEEVWVALAKAMGRSAAEVGDAVGRAPQRAAVEASKLLEGLPTGLASIARFVRAAGVVRPDGLYVDFGNRRHDQGAVYTPTTITEPMVRRALEPLIVGETDRQPRSARDILGLRVCDPAMGSAAFLVQAVRFLAERLVDAWDDASTSTASAALTMPYASVAEGLSGELLLPDSREERVLWARRFIAERCVYGIDINPLAVEMAKLSLWLATAAPTKPFTFLNHVLRCGNAVVGADLQQVRTWSIDRKGDRQPLFATLLEGTVKDAVQARHNLARLTGRASEGEKRLALKRAESATARFSTAADLLVGSWLSSGDDTSRASKASAALAMVISARTDADWNALASIARTELGDVRPFHWTSEFPDVFIEGQGFDAVVGNPPYVRQEILSPIKPILKRAFAAFDGSADLYVYFYELGLRMLRPGGRLSLIVTNKWMKAGYGEALRKVFNSSSWLESIVDFGHAKQLFKDVDVFPCILIATRPDPSASAPTTTRVCVIDRKQLRLDDLDAQIRDEGYEIPRDHFGAEPWVLETSAVRALMAKLEMRGTSLQTLVGSTPQYGIKTGLNEAFLISESQRRRLVDKDPGASTLFGRLVRGRDIKRWHIEWGQQWILLLKSSENTRWPWSDAAGEAEHVFAKTYPSVHEFMLPMKDRLQRRADKGRFWWELRSCAYYAAFERPKITYQVIQYSPRFALDESGMYGNDKMYFIPSEDSALLAVLNSPLMWWYCWRVLGHMKDDALNPSAVKMARIPIPDFTNEVRRSIVSTVDAIGRARAEADQLWNRVDVSINERWPDASSALVLGARKGADGLRAAFKKSVPLDVHPTKSELRDLSGILENVGVAIADLRVCEREHEANLSDLVFEAFGLTETERALVWETAPPRTPLASGAPENATDDSDE